jgi:HlyD family secretion protein
MTRRLAVSLTLLFLVAAGLLAWWFTRAPVVPAFRVQIAPLVRTLQFSGRVATLSRVDIGSTLTARVRQVAVIEGAQVKQGDVLVRLENDELRAALEQAMANEAQVRARLGGLRSTGRSATQASQAQADSVLTAARAELRRTQELVKKGFISQARLDEVRRSVEVAQAQQSGARAQSTAISERGTELAQAQAQTALAEAATASAQARLAQTELIAPANARVLSRLVEPGQIVQPGRALLSLALAGPLLLVAQVDERYLEQLQIGQTVAVLADAFPEQRFSARVRSIAPLVDSQRGAIEVKFSVEQEPPTFLREDMTLSLEVETARRDQALVVPVAALRSDVTALLIERNGRVESRTVRIGLRTLQWAEVLEGLAADDLILIGRAPKIGSRVRADPTASLPKLRSGVTPEDAGSAMSNAMGR